MLFEELTLEVLEMPAKWPLLSEDEENDDEVDEADDDEDDEDDDDEDEEDVDDFDDRVDVADEELVATDTAVASLLQLNSPELAPLEGAKISTLYSGSFW